MFDALGLHMTERNMEADDVSFVFAQKRWIWGYPMKILSQFSTSLLWNLLHDTAIAMLEHDGTDLELRTPDES